MIEVRWHGRGGQGAFTAARLLGLSAALFENKYALAFPTFGPERRGAPVLGYTKIDTRKIRDRSAIISCDAIVVLDETLITNSTFDGIKPGGVIVVNSRNPERYAAPEGSRLVAIDATGMALSILGKPIVNTALLGALVAAAGVIGIEAAAKGIEKEMGDLASKNIELLLKAYEAAGGINGQA